MSELLELIEAHESEFRSKARLSSLYSDFALLKASNPDGYAANSAAWRAALIAGSQAGLTKGQNRLLLGVGETLVEQLESDSMGRPLALNSVINDMVADGSLVPMKDFLNATKSIHKGSWVSLPTWSGVSKWMLSQLGLGSTSSGRLPDADFVVIKSVDQAAQSLLKEVKDQADSSTSLLFNSKMLVDKLSTLQADLAKLTADDVDVLIKYISRDKNLAAVEHSMDGETIIKFGNPTSSSPPAPITQNDRTIAALRALEWKLQSQSSNLVSRIAQSENLARTELASNHRDRALVALRQRKALEATLDKRSTSLSQIQSVLNSIDEAAGQVEMVRAMEASTEVLRDLNRQVGGVERVDTVMDKLKENMDDVNDIQSVLAEPGAEQVDDSELDEELEALREQEAEVEADARHQKQSDVLKEAPEAPTASPARRRTSDESLGEKINNISLES